MNKEKITFMVAFSAGDDEMKPDTVKFTRGGQFALENRGRFGVV